MKKIAIVTISNSTNYGNRLQNYALQNYIFELGCEPYTLINLSSEFDNKKNFFKLLFYYFKLTIKKVLNLFKNKNREKNRKLNFSRFDKKYINFSDDKINNNINSFNNKLLNKFDFFIAGSDQIWNPQFLCNAEANFLYYVPCDKKRTYAPSFGTNHILENRIDEFKKYLSSFDCISVREEKGKKIVEELIGKKNTEVLIDPTMLLTSKEWDKISKRPKMLKTEKFILNYFLGNLSEARKKEIQRIAKENDCEIINILDKNSPYYECGPSEFLYLEKNAFLICTDSFHSSVFAILYNRPFVIFDREQKNIVSMNSRLETLINKFHLKNRKFEGKITEENLNHNYTEAYKILEKERKKSEKFLKNALDIKD